MSIDDIPGPPDDFIAATVAYLETEAATDAIADDPYWPKWDGPWWRMTLLWELGLARRIPQAAVKAMARAVDKHYLHTFPVTPEEIAAIAARTTQNDPRRHVLCHCAAGTIVQVLEACGVDVAAALPWLRPFMLDYQLDDGGLNCDEGAYMKPGGKASVLSTVCAMEAILRPPRQEPPVPALTDREASFVDRCAEYLIAHRLVRRASGDGGIIDEAWLLPCFPRFYDYDALRGLTALARWADQRERELPRAAIGEVWEALQVAREDDGGVRIGRVAAKPEQGTLVQRTPGEWVRVDTSATFPLLDAVSVVGTLSRPLTAELRATHKILARLDAAGRIT